MSHTILSGENFLSIAKALKMSELQLKALNPEAIQSGAYKYRGTVLRTRVGEPLGRLVLPKLIVPSSPSRKAVSPFHRKPTLTQWKHDSVIYVNKKPIILDQDAFDLILRGYPAQYSYLQMPLAGVVTKNILEIPNKADGWFQYQVYDGSLHNHLHCKLSARLRVGSKLLKGNEVGFIDPTPVNATGSHDHYWITNKYGKVLDIDKWYRAHGLTNWYKDPNNLNPN